MTQLVLGTRGSALALAQAKWVQAALLDMGAADEIRLEIIHTRGDKILDVPLAKVGGKGLFVKEIEAALLSGDIDLAVHSLKDMPVEQPEGLVLAAFPEREDPRDRLIVCSASHMDDEAEPARPRLKAGATVGTSSLRRVAQIKALFPGVEVVSIRGNVGTRLGRLSEPGQQGLDAVVLAQAGLNRLELSPPYGAALSPDEFVPAVGQGALAIECREGDARTLAALSTLDHQATRLRITAERSFLKTVEGSCQVPVGAFARICGEDTLQLDALIASLDGREILRASRTGRFEDSVALGVDLGQELLARGGDRLLKACLAEAEG